MVERAHPDNPGFRNKWRFCMRRKFIPWIILQHSPYRQAFLWRYRWAGRYCKACDVLDIPCGMGWGTSLLEGCKTLVGIDISPDAIAEARQRYGMCAKFLVGDMTKLEFSNESFDVVVCLEGIEHVRPEIGDMFIYEADRVLRPGGLLLLSSPHCRTKEHSGNPYHVKEYKPEEIRALINPAFEVVDVVERDVDNLTVTYFHTMRR